MSIKRLKDKFQKAASKQGMEVLSQESLQWFYDFTKKFAKTATFGKMKDEGKIATRIVPGRLYLYKYDPKTKEDMPYYDAMPLVLVTGVTPQGWYGINFHYMPPKARFKIMEALLETLNNPAYTDHFKMKINWEKAVRIARGVGANRYLQHSIKQYLGNHLTSSMIELHPEAWEMALFLPLQKFKKKGSSFVWKDV